MAKLYEINLLATGKVTEPHPTIPGTFEKWVYQRTGKGKGHRRYSETLDIQRRRWVQTPSPSTPLKDAHKQRYADAVIAWQTSTPEERQALDDLERKWNLPTYQTFIKLYCINNPVSITPDTITDTTRTPAQGHTITPNATPPTPSDAANLRHHLSRFA
jgi:hypothetical protein